MNDDMKYKFHSDTGKDAYLTLNESSGINGRRVVPCKVIARSVDLVDVLCFTDDGTNMQLGAKMIEPPSDTDKLGPNVTWIAPWCR